MLKEVYDTCEVPCQASRILPKETMEYKTETKPPTAGSFLNADVMEEARQKVLVLRDNLTSYTSTTFIKDQTKNTLRDSLLILASRTRLNRSPVQCRVDAHSSLKGLAKDGTLEKMGLLLEVGHPKNPNHNSVAETAIKELRQELVKLSPQGGRVSEKTLALATENLNSRIRHLGRSARELWTSRDQVSGANLTLDDQNISDKQHAMRMASHPSSATYASRKAPLVSLPEINPGQAVFIKSDRSKSKARDQYMVLSVDSSESLATLQKLPMSNFKANPLKVQLQNLYPCRTPPRPLPSAPPTEELPDLTPSPTKHLPPTKKSPKPPHPKIPAPAYPRLTQDSSDSEDEDIHWFSTAPVPQGEENQPDPPPAVAEHLLPEVEAEDIAEVGPEDILEDQEEDIINDAVSVHGDEDLGDNYDEQAAEADNPIEDVEEESQLVPFSEEMPMFQPKVKKKGELKVGDTVLRFSKKSKSWEKVRLSKKYGKIYQNGSYKFEFTDLDGSNPRRNFFYPGAYWSQLNEEEVDLDLATLTTQVDITAAINTSEEEPPVEHLDPEKDRLATLEGELKPEIPLDLYTSLMAPPLLDLSFSPLPEDEIATNSVPQPPPPHKPLWDQLKTFLRPSLHLARTLLGSVSQEQPRAATPPALVPTPTMRAAAPARVRGLHTTGNHTSPLDPTDCFLLMSDLVPLQQLPLTPTLVPLAASEESYNTKERIASDAQSALQSFSAVAHSSERFVSDAQSALGPLRERASSALTLYQERSASDAQSALGSSPPPPDQFNHRSTEMGLVASELSGTTPPPACAQIPHNEAAALASVRRLQPSGNQLYFGNLSDLLLLMSETALPMEMLVESHRDELHAAYLDLSRHATRRRSASFHASRSTEAVAVRCQDPPPAPRARHQVLERHRHWSVPGTDLHTPTYEVPYRLL